MYLAVLNTTVKLLHQVTLPLSASMKLQPPPKAKKPMKNEIIVKKIVLNPEMMQEWADDSATLYIAATLHYLIKKTILRSSNMTTRAKMLRIKVTGL